MCVHLHQGYAYAFISERESCLSEEDRGVTAECRSRGGLYKLNSLLTHGTPTTSIVIHNQGGLLTCTFTPRWLRTWMRAKPLTCDGRLTTRPRRLLHLHNAPSRYVMMGAVVGDVAPVTVSARSTRRTRFSSCYQVEASTNATTSVT